MWYQTGAMFVFWPVVAICFNSSTIERFLFLQELIPAIIIERKMNITHAYA